MSSAGKSALEYCKSIYASAGAEHLPDTQIWLTAVPGDAARDRGMMSGADQRAVETDDDVIEFVNEWTGKRNIYHKAARFDFDAPGPRIVNTRVFGFAWLDIDLVAKPAVAPQKLIDMACDALDKLTHKPSVINATGGGVQALFHFDEPLVVGTTVEVDGKLYKEYYGSASDFNKGEYKHVEGKRILEPIKGRLADTLREMREDLQSSISYAGGRALADLRKVNYVILGGENAGEHLFM